MNSIRCSKGTLALLCVVGLVAVTGTATAFTVAADGVPSEVAVDEDVTVTYTIDDPFTDAPDRWTLLAETELEGVSWTVTVFRAGTQISEETYGNQGVTQELDIDDNGDEVEIELSGTVPEVENYTYAPREEFTVATLARQTGNNTEEFRNDSAHHFSAESKEARDAIDAAQASIDDAGGNEEAERLLNSSISSYENGNFENAISLANQSAETANQAQQSQQTTRTLLIAAAAIVLLLLLAGGGYYLYSQQGDDYSKL